MKRKTMAIIISAVFLSGGLTATAVLAANGTAIQDKVELTLSYTVNRVVNSLINIRRAELDSKKIENYLYKNNTAIKEINQEIDVDTEGSESNLIKKRLKFVNDRNQMIKEFNKKATENVLRAEAEDIYSDLIIAAKTLEIYKENLKTATELNQKSKASYTAGLIDERVYLISQIGLADTNKRFQSAQNSLENLIMQYNTYTGSKLSVGSSISGNIEKIVFAISDIQSYITKAVNERNEIKALEYMIGNREIAAEIAKVKLTVVSDQYAFAQDQQVSDENNDAVGDNTFQIKKNIEIAELSYAYMDADLLVQQAKLDLERLKKDIELEIRNKLVNIKKIEQNFNITKNSIVLYQKYLDKTLKVFDVMQDNVAQVREAEDNLSQAKLLELQNIIAYNKAVKEFEDSISVGREKIAILN